MLWTIPSIMTSSISKGSTLLNGLVGYWKMDEASGNIADSSGNGNTGTANGSLTYSQTGKINNAILFDGSSAYFDAGNTSSLSVGNLSISAWVYCTNVTARNTIVDKMTLGDDFNGYHIEIYSDGTIYYEFANATTHNGNFGVTSLSANTWYNVVFTLDGSNVKLYINGILETGFPKSQTVTPVSNVWNFMIGRRADAAVSFFNGMIDELGIWNRALTSTEVTTLYNSGSGKSYPF